MRLIAGGVALLALVLAGCTDAPPPASPPITGTYSPSPTATTEDLPGPPGYPFPPEAMEYTEAGAIAFFNYYIDLLNKTTENLDSEPIRLLAGPECFGCERRIELYNSDRMAGLHYEGGITTITQDPVPVQLRPDVQGGAGALINTGGTSSPLNVLDASGVLVEGRAYPSYDLSISVEIAWLPGQLSWQVAALSLVVA